MRKLIVFDLDGTLAESKSSLDDEMAELLNSLLGVAKVAIISGGGWPQFEKQVLANLPHGKLLKDLSLLPTCGTKFFAYDSGWKQLYAENFTTDQREKILTSLKKSIEESDLNIQKTWGDQIEDRGSQITFSALGQGGKPLDAKKDWDPDFARSAKR